MGVFFFLAETVGFSPGLKKCPPDTFLPRLRRGRPLRIPPSQMHIKKKKTPMGVFFFLAETVGFEPTCGCPLTDFESAPL